jgi:hypothetical protein
MMSIPKELTTDRIIPDEEFNVPDEGLNVPDEGLNVPDEGFNVPDEGYSGKALCALSKISTFVLQ